MHGLVWLVLKDGRSVVAGCGSATRDSLASALREPDRTLTFTSDDAVEHIPSTFVRGFVIFESKTLIPSAASIYRLVQI
jgi:hypothetical protein